MNYDGEGSDYGWEWDEGFEPGDYDVANEAAEFQYEIDDMEAQFDAEMEAEHDAENAAELDVPWSEDEDHDEETYNPEEKEV